jgi:hypothetical protein
MTKTKEQRTRLGPATDQSGRPRSKFGGRGRFNNFDFLPANIKLEAERMIENGATFEDTTEWINERHAPDPSRESYGEGEGVTLLAVRHYFQSNPELQGRRIRRMQGNAQKLKKALTGDPHSAEAELADAVFLTGLMGLERAGTRFTVKDAARHFLTRGSLDLKSRNLEAALRLAEERIKTEIVKREQLKQRVREVAQAIEKEGQGRELGPETLRKIQEIYGLVGQ